MHTIVKHAKLDLSMDFTVWRMKRVLGGFYLQELIMYDIARVETGSDKKKQKKHG